nr:LuxR C-terminal-related transcriptional regulator [Halomonas cerina]
MYQGKGAIILVTEQNPQSQLFTDHLREQFDCPVFTAAPDDEYQLEERHRKEGDGTVIILMDTDHADESAMQHWQGQTVQHHDVHLTAFNLRNEEHAAELLTFMHLRGVFYRQDSLAMICKGINRLFEGDMWMSRTLMKRLIEFFRRQQANTYRPACGLTQRELEIMGLLGSGASNLEIADRLFVSEHTVKSHIYNIFKKINVHNRLQASNWARENLGAPPPLYPLKSSRTTQPVRKSR